MSAKAAKAAKSAIIKAFDEAYSAFPADRALHLAQGVFASICDGRDDAATLTLSDICKELGGLVLSERVSMEEITTEIEESKINGRLSGALLDSVVEQESIQRRRQLDDYRAAQDAEAVAAAADAKLAAEKMQKQSRRTKAKIVLCGSCGAEPGLCDCGAALAKQQARDKKKEVLAERKLQLLRQESSDDDDDDVDVEEDEESDEDEQDVSTTTRSSKKVKQLDLNDPGVVLDPKFWPRLAVRYLASELQSAVKAQYHDVFETHRHDACFISSVWLQYAAVLKESPNAAAVLEAVKGIRLCRARFEFMLGKKQGALMASTVEAELLDQALPSDLQRARKAGRLAEKHATRVTAPVKPEVAKKPGGKK